MDPNNRTQEHLVGIYRNAVQPLSWLEDVTEASSKISNRIGINEPDKIRLHLLSMGELDKVDVRNFDEAQMIAEKVEQCINPTFHHEIDVAFAGVQIFTVGKTENRLINAILKPDEILEDERYTASMSLPWAVGARHLPKGRFNFGIRIGTVYDPNVSSTIVRNTLRSVLPDKLRLQKGKIKTLE